MMNMQSAMGALSGGSTVDVRAVLGANTTSADDDGSGGTLAQDSEDRPVSLG